jgi:hypothetical protein
MNDISLQEAAERLSSYLGDYVRFALDERLGSGRVPVIARRSDLPALMLRDNVEHLLAKASRVYTAPANNTILAHFKVCSEREADALFGPKSNWRGLDWDWRVECTEARVDWPKLMETLRQASAHPANEAELVKSGVWSESWGTFAPALHVSVNAETETAGPRRRGINKTLHDTVTETLSAYGIPGETKKWGEFYRQVRSRAGIKSVTRGYGDKTIQRMVSRVQTEAHKQDK